MRFFALFLACLCAGCAEAKPHPRLKHVAEIVYNFGLPAGTSLLATREIHKCRQEFGIGPCPNGGYGEFRTRMALNFGISVGLGTLSHFWHKDCDCKESFIPTTGVIVWNTVTAIQAATHKGPHAD